jgi:hypothetical protein
MTSGEVLVSASAAAANDATMRTSDMKVRRIA